MKGKILAIDFGLKRTGLAITDDACIFAFGLKTVASSELMGELKKLIPAERIHTLVLGLPRRLNLEDSHITENVRLLAEALRKEFVAEVILFDERFTSSMASKAIQQAGLGKSKRENKALVDEVSATIILQSYLSSIS